MAEHQDDPGAAERALAAFWTAYTESDERRLRYAVRHRAEALRALDAVRRLPVLECWPGPGAGGRAVAGVLDQPGGLGLPLSAVGPAVLEIPRDVDTYLEGSSRQTLRRKIRKAEKAGLKTRPVTDGQEKRELLALANAAEQAHRDATYRVERPDNDDLFDHDLWLVVEDGEARPVLLAVVPVDGRWATLRYFRTLGAGPVHSDSRYLATAEVVAALADCGVRWLLDTEHPGSQTNGIRHFQRMVGFRYHRVRRHGRSFRPRLGR